VKIRINSWPRLGRAVAGVFVLTLATVTGAQAQMPESFVYLRDIDPTIAQDMRYAGLNNFTGAPLSGYDAAECILRREAALALKAVQADLAASGYGLKVYDCYRPEQAVRAMWRWATDGRDGAATKRFFPRLEKRNLFALGYIATHSRHSAGTTADLTLVPLNSAPIAAFDPRANYGSCAGAASQRVPDSSLDMGTSFDCFDERSRTNSAAITAEQHQHRMQLVAAMTRRGFRNYFREWWHFAFANSSSAPRYDFPIRPRAQSN
jgi:D-alanyl-D-alanine dipeptidase